MKLARESRMFWMPNELWHWHCHSITGHSGNPLTPCFAYSFSFPSFFLLFSLSPYSNCRHFLSVLFAFLTQIAAMINSHTWENASDRTPPPSSSPPCPLADPFDPSPSWLFHIILTNYLTFPSSWQIVDRPESASFSWKLKKKLEISECIFRRNFHLLIEKYWITFIFLIFAHLIHIVCHGHFRTCRSQKLHWLMFSKNETTKFCNCKSIKFFAMCHK